MSNRAFPVNKISMQLSISKTLQFPILRNHNVSTFPFPWFRFRFRIPDFIAEYKSNRMTETLSLNWSLNKVMDVFAYLDGWLPAHWSSDNLYGSRSLAHFHKGLLFSREYHRYSQWHTEIHQHEKDLALFRLFQFSLTEIWRNRQPLQIRPVWHDVQLGWLLICRSLKKCLRLLEETNPTTST